MSLSPASFAPFDLDALSPLARELATAVARVSSDIALVIDEQGVIRSVAEGTVPLAPGCGTWVGRHWADVASADTRGKIEQLLGELRASGVTRRREVNHPLPEGGAQGGQAGQTGQLPLAWSAIRLGPAGPYLAVGRDLRAVAAIQQRFLDAQQELERGYWQRQQSEQRLRVLFHVERDAILIVDAKQHAVVEANEAAARWLGHAQPAAAVGLELAPMLASAVRGAVTELLGQAGGSGRAGEIRVRAAGAAEAADDISATPFRADDRQLLLVRVRRAEASTPAPAPQPAAAPAPAVLVADPTGRILMANRSFVELASAPDDSTLRGRGLAEVLGETAPGWSELLASVRRQGLVTQAALQMRPAGGAAAGAAPVLDVTATLLTDGEQECVGITLRPRDAAPGLQSSALPSLSSLSSIAASGRGPVPSPQALDALHTLDELAEQAGRTPLHELLSEAAQAGERHLLGAVLDRCSGDAVRAARLLDLSPPALLLQLRRLGMDRGYTDTPPSIN